MGSTTKAPKGGEGNGLEVDVELLLSDDLVGVAALVAGQPESDVQNHEGEAIV